MTLTFSPGSVRVPDLHADSAGNLPGIPRILPGGQRIRPIRWDDGPALQAGLARLSPRSRWLRFHQPLARFSEAQLRILVEVDHYDRDALLAEAERPDGSWQLVGVARYARVAPDRADAAVVVGDPWQRQGIGRLLLERLGVLARERGIAVFVGEVLTENRGMIHLIRSLGPRAEIRLLGTTTEVVWRL